MSRLGSAVRRAALRLTSSEVPTYRDAPAAYWDWRHATQGESLDGVGQIGLGHAANLVDYNEKWRQLAAVLDRCGVDPMGRALDAGCGTGFLTERLRLRGHLVAGVDFSHEALMLARSLLGGGVPLQLQPIDQPMSGAPFDLALCVDVLFHIVDDGLWRTTVANLATSVESHGALLIQEHLNDGSEDAGASHVRWRSLDDYRHILAGWDLLEHHTYVLPQAETTKDILVFARP